MAFLIFAFGATRTIRAQELENNCATEAWAADRDLNLTVCSKPNINDKAIAKLKNGKDDNQLTVYIIGLSNGWAKMLAAPRKARTENTTISQGFRKSA